MFKGHPLKSYVVYSVTAAIVYSIAAFIYLRNDTFRSAWVLFIGNALFACCIVAFIFSLNRKENENASIGKMVFAGHITTVMGIIISCIIAIILFFLLPEISYGAEHGGINATLHHAPPQLRSGKRNEYLLTLMLNAVIGNISAGSVISIILPWATKKNSDKQ